MDKARDVRRRRHFNKLASRGVPDSEEKTRKEKFQSLCLVGRANSSFRNDEKPMGPSDASHREEGPRTVGGRKRFKLPRKLLEDCNSAEQASVPRKIRSAMKKRSRESLSPPTSDAKKPKYLIRGSESPKGGGAKKTKKHGRSRSAFSEPVTKDEEEVVEILYALAGMFLNNNDCGRADEESLQADVSAIRGGIEASTTVACEAVQKESKPSLPSCKEERLSEETTRSCRPDGPIIRQQEKMPDSKLFGKESDRRIEIDLQTIPSHPWSGKSNNELHTSSKFKLDMELCLDAHINQPQKMDLLYPLECKQVAINGNKPDLHHKIEKHQNSGPALWPGLLTTSVSRLSDSRVPTGLDSAGCSMRHGSVNPVESRFPIEKVRSRRDSDRSRKKCVKHVFICHLIQTLKMPPSEDRSLFQLNNSGRQHKETEQCVNTVGPGFSFLKNGSCQDLVSSAMAVSVPQRNTSKGSNIMLQQNRHSQGLKAGLSETQGFDFLSLFTSVSIPDQKPNIPRLHPVPRQQLTSASLSTSKPYYSNPYSDHISGLNPYQQVLHQLPSYQGNSGWSLHRGPVVTPKEFQHRRVLWAGPTASPQFKHTGSPKAAATQFPTWRNGRTEPALMVPFPAIVPPPPPSSGEVLVPKHSQQWSQQHLLHYHQQQLPRSAHEETIPRFLGGGAVSLQVLCNEHMKLSGLKRW